MAEAPFSNDDYHDFKYYDHDDDNDFESDRIWGKAKRVRGDTEEAAQAVGGHSGIVLKSFVCYKYMSFVWIQIHAPQNMWKDLFQTICK